MDSILNKPIAFYSPISITTAPIENVHLAEAAIETIDTKLALSHHFHTKILCINLSPVSLDFISLLTAVLWTCNISWSKSCHRFCLQHIWIWPKKVVFCFLEYVWMKSSSNASRNGNIISLRSIGLYLQRYKSKTGCYQDKLESMHFRLTNVTYAAFNIFPLYFSFAY